MTLGLWAGPQSKGVPQQAVYSRLRKVGIWAWDDVGMCSFFLSFWDQRTVIFQLSGLFAVAVCSLQLFQLTGPPRLPSHRVSVC